MSSEKGLRAEGNSRILEGLTGAALFAASALWVFWQNSRVAVLWDLSYLLDSAWRFSLGQRPYRDIPFAHAPLTFLLQAALIRVFGRVYWPHLAWAALAGGVGTVLAWRLLVWVLRPLGTGAWRMGALLAAPLVPLGIYGVYPHPIYDNDCILACLLSLFLLTGVDGDVQDRRIAGIARCVLAGAVCAFPVFFKQNIGIPFFGAAVAAMGAVAIGHTMRGEAAKRELLIICGAFAGLGAGVLLLQGTVGLRSYLHWTVQFAAQRRLPGLAPVLAAYRQELLLWGPPCVLSGAALLRWQRIRREKWAAFAGFLLITAPFLWTLLRFALDTDADDRADELLALWPLILLLASVGAIIGLRRQFDLRTLMPWILLVTIHGAFLAQQLWGSTYACWPLLMLLIAGLLVLLREIRWQVAALVSCTLLICGGMYAASLERLSYIHLDGPAQRSAQPILRGMRTAGPWLPEFDKLVRFTDAEISKDAGVLLIPGEDPFFLATGRVPHFPALLFDPATYPYSPEETVALARTRGIKWLIVKRETQLTAPPYEAIPAIVTALQRDFVLYRRVGFYDVYRRSR